jgi:hypothetical protein
MKFIITHRVFVSTYYLGDAKMRKTWASLLGRVDRMQSERQIDKNNLKTIQTLIHSSIRSFNKHPLSTFVKAHAKGT